MRDYDLAELDDGIFALSDAVGPRRRNRRNDVLKVETLLANAGDHDLEDGPTGYAGAHLDQAIRAFQKRRELEVDGVLEPDGETIAQLERELGGRLAGFRAPRPEEADDHLNRAGRGDEPLFETRPPAPVLHPIRNLPAVSAAAYQSNRRTIDALFRTADNRGLADLLADAIGHDGLGGVAEVRDMLDQIRDHSPERADTLARALFDRLPEKEQLLFAGGPQPERQPVGVLLADKASDQDRIGIAGTEPPVEPSEVEGRTPLPSEVRPLGDVPSYQVDQTKRRYENYAGVGRVIGLAHAAKNLDRYLEGKGEKLEFTREEAREFRFIRAAEAENRARFENQTFVGESGKAEDVNRKLRNLPEGEPQRIVDDWQHTFGNWDKRHRIRAPGDVDAIVAFGETTVESRAAFDATRKGDIIQIVGTVTHSWNDTYDFEKGKSGAEGALLLEREGRAARFPIAAQWSQHVRGAVRIVGDKLVPIAQFQWTDIQK
jgi:hypothetical protein